MCKRLSSKRLQTCNFRAEHMTLAIVIEVKWRISKQNEHMATRS